MGVAPAPVAFEFGGFRLEPRRQTLTDPTGSSIELPSRAFELLTYLVERSGELVTRNDIMRAVWPNVVVAENNLAQHISTLRRVLGEKSGDARFIVTVPGRGYRFVAPVRAEGGAQPARSAEPLAGNKHADAQRQYQHGRALQERPTEQNLRAALACYRRAIVCDNAFAAAHCATAQVHTMLATYEFSDSLMEAERAARQALAIDPRIADARAVLGMVAAFRCDWLGAEAHFSAASAIEASPYVLGARAAYLHAAVGHLARALEDDRACFELAPAVTQNLIRHAMLSRLAGLDAEALQNAELAAALGFPDHAGPIPMIRSHHARRMGRYAEAAEHMVGLFSTEARQAGIGQVIDEVYAALGDRARKKTAIQALRRLLESVDRPLLEPGIFASLLINWSTMLGDLDLGFSIANRALEEFLPPDAAGGPTFVVHFWTPEMEPFRRDPRFRVFAGRLRLIEYWERHGAPDGFELRNGELASLL